MGNLTSTVALTASDQAWSSQAPDPVAAETRRAEVDAFIADHVPAPDVHVHGADEDAIIFCRTVGPKQEACIVTWAALASESMVSGAATAPGLPVMVAAMLRRPVLEAYLESAAKVAPLGPMLLTETLAWYTPPPVYYRLATQPSFAASMVSHLLGIA